MALSSAQIAAIEAKARERGVDPERLKAAAERVSGRTGAPKTNDDAPQRPSLSAFMLPFLTVREIRQAIGLDAPFPGDPQIASDWAARHPADPQYAAPAAATTAPPAAATPAQPSPAPRTIPGS